MNDKHTPTPWGLVPHHKETGFSITAPNGEVIAVVSKRENAEFILRACGFHDAFLAACEKAYEALRGVDTAEYNDEIRQLRKVIEAAKGAGG